MHSMYCGRGIMNQRMLSHETKLSKMPVCWWPASLLIKNSNHYISFTLGLAPTLNQPLPYGKMTVKPILKHTGLFILSASFPKEAELSLKIQTHVT